MSKKSFFWGVVTGIVLTIAVLFVAGLISQYSSGSIQYLEQPENYENKKETSFKVFQVFDDAALADEVSKEQRGWYDGNTVLILGKNFYSDQVVTIKNPQRIGSYSYYSKSGKSMTVPVIEGDIK